MHERDISHLPAERMIGPDATVTLDFASSASPAWLTSSWSIRKYAQESRPLGDLVHSQRVLIALTQKAWRARRPMRGAAQRHEDVVGEGDFLALLKADARRGERI